MALVGGTLIDGGDGPPVRDSVVLVRGGAHRARRHGGHAAGARRLRTDLDRGHDGAARALGPARPPHLQRPSQPRRVVQPRGRVRARHDPRLGAPDAHGGRHERARSGGAGRRRSSASRSGSPAASCPAPRSTPRVRRWPSWSPARRRPRGQFLPIADAADARAKARQLLDQGVDVIKIFFAERMSPDERSAIISQAHARGKKVADARIDRCRGAAGARLGMDDFQHIGIDRPEYPARHHGGAARAHQGGPAALLDADDRRQQPAERRLRRHQARTAGRRPRVVPRTAAGARRRDQGRMARASAAAGRATTPEPSSGGRWRRCRRPGVQSCSAATKAASARWRATPRGWTPTCGCASWACRRWPCCGA